MSVKEIGFGDVPNEFATTRRMLEAVPTDQLEWQPHEKNFTLGQMAGHIANLARWGVMILETDELDLGQPFPPEEPPASTDEVLARFDETTQALMKAMDEADDETLMSTWTLRQGEHVISAMPRAANLRGFVISHMIHHRAHLGMYLRLLDMPVPSVYGPSADEDPFS